MSTVCLLFSLKYQVVLHRGLHMFVSTHLYLLILNYRKWMKFPGPNCHRKLHHYFLSIGKCWNAPNSFSFLLHWSECSNNWDPVADNMKSGIVIDQPPVPTDLSSFKMKQYDVVIISQHCHIRWFGAEQRLNFQRVAYLLKLGLARCLSY